MTHGVFDFLIASIDRLAFSEINIYKPNLLRVYNNTKSLQILFKNQIQQRLIKNPFVPTPFFVQAKIHLSNQINLKLKQHKGIISHKYLRRFLKMS